MKDWRDVFHDLAPKLQRALDAGGNTYDLDDLARATEAGTFKLFYTDSSIVLCELKQFPKMRVVNFFIAAGVMREVFQCEDAALAWAKENGATRATCGGRAGWARPLAKRNWHGAGRVFSKDI